MSEIDEKAVIAGYTDEVAKVMAYGQYRLAVRSYEAAKSSEQAVVSVDKIDESHYDYDMDAYEASCRQPVGLTEPLKQAYAKHLQEAERCNFAQCGCDYCSAIRATERESVAPQYCKSGEHWPVSSPAYDYCAKCGMHEADQLIQRRSIVDAKD